MDGVIQMLKIWEMQTDEMTDWCGKWDKGINDDGLLSGLATPKA